MYLEMLNWKVLLLWVKQVIFQELPYLIKGLLNIKGGKGVESNINYYYYYYYYHYYYQISD